MFISGIQKFTVLDYPEKTACIIFTPGCNFRCGYCHNPEFVLPEKIKELQHSFFTEEPVLRFLTERKGKLDGVVISGGEPTLQKDLLDVMKKIKDMGFLVKLDTNGSNPEVLAAAYDQELIDYVAMDLKSDVAGYGGLVGPAGDATRIQKSIALIMSKEIPYEFRSTLVKDIHSEASLKDMAEMIAGAKKWYGQTFRPGKTLDLAFAEYQAFLPSEMNGIQKIFAEKVQEAFIR
ncbi:anaerobic ribonucleoside-triphosphate reductase activating protein [Patescibacteria group bacterium]|nr:anaerobic ribonucleoside-triphosphate reductase activating protein [Patescibacteria group bacterium]MBU1721663.1 anaerobic ribonucleoside-triphosphate reductase activating protein [Patescibacteria group bacterium]MBU1900972.1 anaerobic ribonucleoside-triphosphate reductase activating protein [Patescibacteria group bacterium]